jgi:5-methylcytosine-specific restriction endonuclease McrA
VDAVGLGSPGQYLLISPTPKGGSSKALSERVRADILERDGHTCQICGAGAGESDPVDPRKKVRLQVDHVDTTLEGPALNSPSNLITKCRACNECQNFVPPPRRTVDITNLLRPAPEQVKREIYDWLCRRLGDG